MRRAWAVARREWTELSRDTYVTVPIVVIPILLTAFMSAVVIGMVRYYGSEAAELEKFVLRMPAGYDALLGDHTDLQKVLLLPVRVFGIPLFLFIPLIVTSIISADSFAGEKERETLEPLLLSPIREPELFVGKLLTSAIPALVMSWCSFLVYGLVILNWVSPFFEDRVFPDARWIATAFLVVPVLILLIVTGCVWISSRLATVRAAMQVNTIFTLPVLGLLMAQVQGAFFLDLGGILALAAALAVAAALALRAAIRSFSRGRLVGY